MYHEHELIRDFTSKNEKAFSNVYDQYAPAIFGSIRKMVSCPLTAEDLLQNAFIKIWSYADTYSEKKGSLLTWMLRIARNETIDFLRSKQGRKEGLTYSMKEEITTAYTPAEYHRYDLSQSFALLAKKEKTILHLFTSGFTCREIGVVLKMPEGTVKSNMRKIYRQLRIILQ